MKLWRYGQPVEYLGRRYRLDGMLGSGGMADVCLAWDEREQREVALKLLKSDDLDQETLNRFMKEAAQIAHWQHPHILRVYESLQVELIDAASGSVLFYMVSEYARGGDLHKRLTPGRPFPLSATFALFYQLCDAVQYAHEHGIIHRDLKPLNILFRRPQSGPEEVVLSDFGLAVQVNASHHTFAHGGTLAYMAPEQFHSHALPASDIFALGVILYLLCTGTLPFHRSLQDIPRIVQGQVPPPTHPSLLNPDLPPALDTVIPRALHDLPSQRYQQPREFWAALELVLATNAPTLSWSGTSTSTAGHTRPYQDAAFNQASEPAQSSPSSTKHPDTGAAGREEGPESALWIAREKQKASPVRLSLPTHSILSPTNPPANGAPAQSPTGQTVPPATWPADLPEQPSTTRAPSPSTWRGDTPARSDDASSSLDNTPPALPSRTDRTGRSPLSGRSDSPSFSIPRTRTSARPENTTLARPPAGDEEYRTSPRRSVRHFPLTPPSQVTGKRLSDPRSGDAEARRVSEHDSARDLATSASTIPTDADAIPVSRTGTATPQPIALPRRPTPPTTPVTTTARRTRSPHTRRHLPLVVILTTLALLVLLLAILAATSFQGPLLVFLGAPVVKVTLQPRAQIVQDTTTLHLLTDGSAPSPSNGQLPGRQLSATSPTRSATATATGSIPAKQATGQLTFINNGTNAVTIQSSVITGNSGIPISFQGPITIPAIPPTVVVNGFAVNPGTKGNIAAFDIVKGCCAPGIVVKNTTAFTNGQDAQPNSVIQQSDIDGAARGLVASGETVARGMLRDQARAGEQVIGDARCQPQIKADQKAGAVAKQVTVQVAVTCDETVYDHAAALRFFTQDLQDKARGDPALGPAYALTGPIALTLVSSATAQGGGQDLKFSAQGLWAYRFTSDTLNRFAAQLAGKSQDAARVWLLRQPGVAGVRFSASGSLPVNTGEIQVVVQNPPSTTP